MNERTELFERWKRMHEVAIAAQALGLDDLERSIVGQIVRERKILDIGERKQINDAAADSGD